MLNGQVNKKSMNAIANFTLRGKGNLYFREEIFRLHEPLFSKSKN